MHWDTLYPLGATALLGRNVIHSRALDCSPTGIASLIPSNSNASVNFAYSLPANSTFKVPPGDTGYPTNPVGLPALCAVSVQVKTPGNTSFGFGLFLPEEWGGRFLTVGNGGFAGGINWNDMGPGTRYKFATMSTDTGHNSSSGSGEWAYNNPEAITNWAYRAMHGSVEISKQIIQGYYSQKPTYSYYLGCSTGGRQGLKEADAYPDDFDGIIAGAPAWWTKRLQPWTVKVALYNLPTTAPHHIPPSLFPTIAAEVLRQCDFQDGVTDTIISDLDTCKFQPDTLLCGTSANSTNCLTPAQITTLNKIHAPSTTNNQTFYFPNLAYGTESQWLLVSDSAPNSLGTDYMRYFLGLGPDWDFNAFNESIQDLADRMDPGNATVNFDLSSFGKKGGKVLMYHGLGDGLIPAGSTEYFYKQANRTLSQMGVEIDQFLKLFWVPGMGHCSGSPSLYNAPWYFSGAGQNTMGPGEPVYSVPGFEDAKHDVVLAMINWVEHGMAPESIIATKYMDEKNPKEILRQRPLCMYPKKAKYDGMGDINAAASWLCK